MKKKKKSSLRTLAVGFIDRVFCFHFFLDFLGLSVLMVLRNTTETTHRRLRSSVLKRGSGSGI